MTSNLRLAVQIDSAVVRSKYVQLNHQVNIAVDTNDLDSHVGIYNLYCRHDVNGLVLLYLCHF